MQHTLKKSFNTKSIIWPEFSWLLFTTSQSRSQPLSTIFNSKLCNFCFHTCWSLSLNTGVFISFLLGNYVHLHSLGYWILWVPTKKLLPWERKTAHSRWGASPLNAHPILHYLTTAHICWSIQVFVCLLVFIRLWTLRGQQPDCFFIIKYLALITINIIWIDLNKLVYERAKELIE